MHLLIFLGIYMAVIVENAGGVAFEGALPSEVLKTNRFIRVYLPPSYLESSQKRYPVLYVHDGQNAFSTAGPYVAFGWGNWQLDKTVDRLVAERKMREIIMVAMDCSASRYREYRGPIAPGADNKAYERYSEFLIKELKPKIDRDYKTLTNAASTGLLGSSMGGICSVALAWQRPDIFGQAASLSGAFQVENKYFLNEVLGKHRGGVKPTRIYLDSGTCDYTGGDDGAKDTAAVAEELQRIGWKEGVDLLHFLDKPMSPDELKPFNLSEDKFKEAQRSQHNEFYWRLRAWRALTFMFPPE